MSEPQWIVEGGCTNIPSSPLDMRPRRSDEESRTGYTPVDTPAPPAPAEDRVERPQAALATENEHFGRRIGRVLRRLARRERMLI
jgi:hypothetical protein